MNNPDYKFVPVARANRPAKRNVKRNGTDELNRCRRVAELLLQGKQGDELETAVKIIDGTGAGTPCRQPAEATPNLPAQPAETSSEFFDWPTAAEISDGCTVPAFRSPLLPPQTVLPSSLNCSAVENMTEMQPVSISRVPC
jgi:hypothetical protein